MCLKLRPTTKKVQQLGSFGRIELEGFSKQSGRSLLNTQASSYLFSVLHPEEYAACLLSLEARGREVDEVKSDYIYHKRYAHVYALLRY